MKTIQFDPNDTAMVEAIKRIPAFTPLSTEQLTEIMKMAAIHDYDRSENIITQGELDHSMFFLMTGKLSVRVNNVEVNILAKPNTVFGEMGVIDSSPRSASVVARRESRCLTLNIGFFDQLEGRSKLAFQAFFYKMFYQILAERLRETNERIADLDMQKVILENMEID